MGRRKIEIQPITHERNRSVTFTKRKNGLFKKAYELGVLCSVDVAVIIFEERAGHQVRQYQYCSSDIHDIIQQHLRHDGEKDVRGPADFSGLSASKLDDDDDDADDDDQDTPARAGTTKRKGDGKLRSAAASGNDISMNVDLDYDLQHRPMAIPHPPPISMRNRPPSSSSIPISSDRHSAVHGQNPQAHPHHRPHPQQSSHPTSGPNKKPRISTTASSTIPNLTSAGAGSAGYTYDPSAVSTSNPAFRPHYPLQLQNATTTPAGYTDFPISNNPYTLPFINQPTPGAFDYPPTSSSRDTPPPPHSHPQQQTQSQRSASFPPSRGAAAYDQRMYPGMIRQQQQRAPDLFPRFLDADEHGRTGQAQGQGPHAQSIRLDWPVHPQGQQPQTHPPGPNMTTAPPISLSASATPDGSNNGPNWLDFLSGSGNKTTASGSGSGGRVDSGPVWHDAADLDRLGGGVGTRSSSGRTSAVASPRPRTGGGGGSETGKMEVEDGMGVGKSKSKGEGDSGDSGGIGERVNGTVGVGAGAGSVGTSGEGGEGGVTIGVTDESV